MATTAPTDHEIITRWRDEPAPLLPILHALHDRDGYLSDEALRSVAAGLRIPVADLFGTVTFYHHFARRPEGREAPRVCTGPVCRFYGGRQMVAALEREGAWGMPCAGRCDEPGPVLKGHEVLVGTEPASLEDRLSPLPPPNPDGYEECVFAQIREPGRATLEGCRATGGYEALENALKSLSPAEIVETITGSELRGRGGAGFPTGVKWRLVADEDADAKYVVCNADEGEPGCFKDRAILDHDPHAVLEGMLLAARATGARDGFIYLRYEYPRSFRILARAIAEAEEAGLLGPGILGTDFDFTIHLRRGAGAYVCGEEGSLLNSLEGKHPFPRNRPPYPVTQGFMGKPTVVNNVETLAAAAQIVRRGADWYRGLGLEGRSGTKVISLSGDIQRPGNYEVPMCLPLPKLLFGWAGGPRPGRQIQAVTMAGLSGGFLAKEDLEAALDEADLRARGSMLGAGWIMVFDDSRDMLEIALSAMAFFADESCGKCFPCRIGTHRLTERLEGSAGPGDLEGWLAEVSDIGETMKALSACGLGIAAPLIGEPGALLPRARVRTPRGFPVKARTKDAIEVNAPTRSATEVNAHPNGVEEVELHV